jgi:hypothetical protein
LKLKKNTYIVEMNNNSNKYIQGKNILTREGANMSNNYRNLTGVVLPRVGAPVTAEYRELVESSNNISDSIANRLASGNNFRISASNRRNSRIANLIAANEAANRGANAISRRVAESVLPRLLRASAPNFVPAAPVAAPAAAAPAAAAPAAPAPAAPAVPVAMPLRMNNNNSENSGNWTTVGSRRRIPKKYSKTGITFTAKTHGKGRRRGTRRLNRR